MLCQYHNHVSFPECTSLIQPMDKGIIQNLKIYYCKNLICRLLNIENLLIGFQLSVLVKVISQTYRGLNFYYYNLFFNLRMNDI